MRKNVLLLAVLLSALAPPARAQSVVEHLYQDFVINVPTDAWHVYTSPFRMETEDLEGLAWVAGAAVVAGIFDAQVQDAMRAHPNSVPLELLRPFTETGPLPFRSNEWGLAHLGDTQTMLKASAVLYLAGLVSGSDDVREAGIGCATADGVNALFRHGLYAVVSRDRPGLKQPDGTIVANDDPYAFGVPGGDWNAHSFFGGHAANPMTCATFWSHRYDLGLLEPLLYGVAAGIGLGRMADERHWLSDTLVGIAFGYAVGKTVANRYERRADDRQAESPEGGGLGAGFPQLGVGDARVSFSLGPAPAGGLVLGVRARF